MDGLFAAKKILFELYIQDIMSMSMNLLFELCLVVRRSLFNKGTAFLASRCVETLRIDGYSKLSLSTYETLAVFRRLMKNGSPMAMARIHTSVETYSFKCAAGLNTLVVEYLLKEKRHMTGEATNFKAREKLV